MIYFERENFDEKIKEAITKIDNTFKRIEGNEIERW